MPSSLTTPGLLIFDVQELREPAMPRLLSAQLVAFRRYLRLENAQSLFHTLPYSKSLEILVRIFATGTASAHLDTIFQFIKIVNNFCIDKGSTLEFSKRIMYGENSVSSSGT